MNSKNLVVLNYPRSLASYTSDFIITMPLNLLFYSGIYAEGCQAHLIRGVVEQNYIFHVMDYALCLSENKKKMCESQSNNSSRITNMLALNLIVFFLGNMIL